MPTYVDLAHVHCISQSLKPDATYFCVEFSRIMFQSPHSGLLPNEMGYEIMLSISVSLMFHTFIPDPFFFI